VSSWRFLLLAAASVCSCATYSSLDGLGSGSESGGAGGSAAGALAEGGDGDGGSSVRGGSSSSAGSGGKPSGGTPGSAGSSAGGSVKGGSSGEAGAAGNTVKLHPDRLTLAEASTDVLRETDPAGEAFADRCDPNEVVIGFYGTVDDPAGVDPKGYLRSVQAVCGKLSIAKSEPWLVSVTETTTLPLHKLEAPEQQIVKCPTNQVMTGFAGRSGLWLDSFDIRCAKLTILGTSPSFLLVIGTPSTAGTIGGPTGGSPFDPMECPADSLAVGQSGRTIYSGDVFGALGVQCATVTLELAE
jgi:hypothetical protein